MLDLSNAPLNHRSDPINSIQGLYVLFMLNLNMSMKIWKFKNCLNSLKKFDLSSALNSHMMIVKNQKFANEDTVVFIINATGA